jgi:hypothetical protein
MLPDLSRLGPGPQRPTDVEPTGALPSDIWRTIRNMANPPIERQVIVTALTTAGNNSLIIALRDVMPWDFTGERDAPRLSVSPPLPGPNVDNYPLNALVDPNSVEEKGRRIQTLDTTKEQVVAAVHAMVRQATWPKEVESLSTEDIQVTLPRGRGIGAFSWPKIRADYATHVYNDIEIEIKDGSAHSLLFLHEYGKDGKQEDRKQYIAEGTESERPYRTWITTPIHNRLTRIAYLVGSYILGNEKPPHLGTASLDQPLKDQNWVVRSHTDGSLGVPPVRWDFYSKGQWYGIVTFDLTKQVYTTTEIPWQMLRADPSDPSDA